MAGNKKPASRKIERIIDGAANAILKAKYTLTMMEHDIGSAKNDAAIREIKGGRRALNRALAAMLRAMVRP